MDYCTIKGFTKKGIDKISRSVRACVYLVLTSQVQARSNIVGNSAPAVDGQQALIGIFKALINEEYSIGTDNERYQGVLEHALSKVGFPVGIGIYMFPSYLNLSIGKTKGYNNKVLMRNKDTRIGSNRHKNSYHKKLSVVKPDVPKTVIPVAWHEVVGVTRPHNLRMLAEKHNDGKLAITLLIVGNGLITCHFW